MNWKWIEYQGYDLRAPKGFNPEVIAGGCGPGRWGNKFIPNSILGVSIVPACDIHDFCWLVAEDEAGKVWRNAVHKKVFEIMGEVETGTRPIPTWEELKAELPTIEWPEVS